MTLTKGDKVWIKNTLDDVLFNGLDSQEQKFDAKIVEVKSDFYDKIDPILKEVLANQEERTILSHKVSDHEQRIENVEKKLSVQPAV
jgi:hypothetical protein